jgi:hypothetical protein
MSSKRQATASPFELYEAAKAEFARLRRGQTSSMGWIRFANDVLESVMACQSVVIEKQRLLREGVRDGGAAETLSTLRTEAKDALFYVDQLTDLYQRARQES